MQATLLKIIDIYRKTYDVYNRNCCRFYPSCSEYAAISIKKYGTMKGLALAICRISRCNQFFSGGFDPVK
jgi:putative membrane protein insertion efficiency factor